MGSRGVMCGPCCAGGGGEHAGLPGLLRDLQRLSEDQDSADIVFLLGPHEERVYAHKIILSARFFFLIFPKSIFSARFRSRKYQTFSNP